VTLISKLFKFLKIKDLMDLLLSATLKEQTLLSEIRDQEENKPTIESDPVKGFIIEILLSFFSTFPQSLDELSECSPVRKI